MRAELLGLGQLLRNALTERWHWFSSQYPTAATRWSWCDDLTRSYLLCRAGDLLRLGERLTDFTFPESTLFDSRELVRALQHLLTDTQERLAKTQREQQLAWIEQRIASKTALISYTPPATLPARVLTERERDATTQACLQDLSTHEQAKVLLAVIDDFVRFCYLLSQPENHIKEPSKQYTEKQVNTRQVHDMAAEMAQELINLPRHTAYAKVVQECDGQQIVLKRKIRTLSPLPEASDDRSSLAHEALTRTHTHYCTARDRIEQDLRSRHDAWRQAETDRRATRVKKPGSPHTPKAPDPETPPQRRG